MWPEFLDTVYYLPYVISEVNVMLKITLVLCYLFMSIMIRCCLLYVDQMLYTVLSLLVFMFFM